MDLSKPLDLSREARSHDESGIPMGTIEQMRKADQIRLVDDVDDFVPVKTGSHSPPVGITAKANVLVWFPPGRIFTEQTGCLWFVRWRNEVDGKRYGVIRTGVPG